MRTNPFNSTEPMIVPSILSADFAILQAEIDDVLDGGADFLHLDILDGHFAPNISFGPPVIECIRPRTRAYFDAHLMISEPLRYAPTMVKAGANNITFHVEVAENPAATARELRKLGCNVGITLNPATPVESIYPALDEVDLVLIMSVVPGFSGQQFMPEVLPKAEQIRKRLGPGQRMQIDGGIKADNIRRARDAGVDWFVVASGIYGHKDRKAAITELRRQLA
jgi:ribulose-phosphate 3-epimerase